jgi:hypothetical protein
MSGYLSNLIESVEQTAEWRRGKAEQFPDDSRNSEAAEELDQLAEELNKLLGTDVGASLEKRLDAIEALIEKNDWWDVYGAEWISETLRGIGFRSGYYSGEGLLNAYIEELERELKIHIDAENAEVLENDPEAKAAGALYEMAVKAAKPAYDEAVRAAQEAFDEAVRPAKLALEQANAKALAKARGRLG